jgi:hypothetical protein
MRYGQKSVRTFTGDNKKPARPGGRRATAISRLLLFSPGVWLDSDRAILILEPDAPSSRGMATRQRIRADFVNVVPTQTEAIDYALDALLGIGRPDRFAVGVVDSRNRRHGREAPISQGRRSRGLLEGAA